MAGRAKDKARQLVAKHGAAVLAAYASGGKEGATNALKTAGMAQLVGAATGTKVPAPAPAPPTAATPATTPAATPITALAAAPLTGLANINASS